MTDQIITKAPEYIAVLTDNRGFWISIIAATITFLAVVVALFQEKIKDFYRTAKLDVNINLEPPDCHQIALTDSMGSTICNSIYIRFRVQHLSGDSAENVELMLSNFWRVKSDGLKEVVKEFLPMNLVWSHFQPPKIEVRIPKKLFRHCDFGSFRPLAVNNGTILKLDTMVQPNPVAGGDLPNVILPGKYNFEVMISGNNVKPLTKRWSLEFKNAWSEDESEMLNRIKIVELLQISDSILPRLISGKMRVK
jgi:hypothetical protein